MFDRFGARRSPGPAVSSDGRPEAQSDALTAGAARRDFNVVDSSWDLRNGVEVVELEELPAEYQTVLRRGGELC